MASDPARIIEEYENRVRGIVGESITAVRYYEIKYPSGQPLWQAKDFDSVDYGLEIQTEAKRLFTIIWESSSVLGLLFYEGSIDRELRAGQAVWDVADLSRWRDFLGRSITKTRVYWGNGETPDLEYVPAPDGISLEFDTGGTVLIQYGEFSEETRGVTMGDNVTVFFDDETARFYRAGPYMPESFKYR